MPGPRHSRHPGTSQIARGQAPGTLGHETQLAHRLELRLLALLALPCSCLAFIASSRRRRLRLRTPPPLIIRPTGGDHCGQHDFNKKNKKSPRPRPATPATANCTLAILANHWHGKALSQAEASSAELGCAKECGCLGMLAGTTAAPLVPAVTPTQSRATELLCSREAGSMMRYERNKDKRTGCAWAPGCPRGHDVRGARMSAGP